MKKLKVFAVTIVLVILFVVGAFMLRYQKMASTIVNEYNKIENVDLNQIADGVYSGVFGDFLVSVNLEVTVKEHRIANITIKDQSSGKGYEARDTVDRILKSQSSRVDAVTGATGSSKTIMIAVNRALKKTK